MDHRQPRPTLTPGPSPRGRGETNEPSPRGGGESPASGTVGVCVSDLVTGSGIAVLEARSLLAFALRATRESLITQTQRAVEASAAGRFRELCERRKAGEPMAYLLGQREFFGRPFRVDPSVLIPRPETECLIDLALQLLSGLSGPSVIDLGTGSGCIAVTLALERPDAQVWATDVSDPALELARINASELGAHVTFLHGHWFAPVQGRFDLIVSNPPYIAPGDPHLDELRCEPRGALTDGRDGLSCLRAIIEQSSAYLSDGGALLVEHGFDQGAAVRALMRQNGLRSAQTRMDLAGLERVCLARR
jgi:release factor glutamine methyltransferase